MSRYRLVADGPRPDIRDQAMDFLQRHLTAEQQETMRTRQYFDVTGSSGRQWRIFTFGQTGNVALIHGPGDLEGFCAAPWGATNAAAWLAQMITLQTDERLFTSVANRYPLPDFAWRELPGLSELRERIAFLERPA